MYVCRCSVRVYRGGLCLYDWRGAVFVFEEGWTERVVVCTYVETTPMKDRSQGRSTPEVNTSRGEPPMSETEPVLWGLL